MPLMRQFDTPGLNEVLRELYALYEGSVVSTRTVSRVVTTTTAPATGTGNTTQAMDALVNTGPAVIQLGHVIGLDASGNLALADATTASLVLPWAVAHDGPTTTGGDVPVSFTGKRLVKVMPGVYPAKGDVCWLAAGGLTTNTQPTATRRIVVGQFASTLGVDNLAWAVIALPQFNYR